MGFTNTVDNPLDLLTGEESGTPPIPQWRPATTSSGSVTPAKRTREASLSSLKRRSREKGTADHSDDEHRSPATIRQPNAAKGPRGAEADNMFPRSQSRPPATMPLRMIRTSTSHLQMGSLSGLIQI